MPSPLDVVHASTAALRAALSAGLNRGVSHAVLAPAGSSPAGLILPAAHAVHVPDDTYSFSSHLGWQVVSHASDLQSESVEHAAPSALHPDAVHAEVTEPVAPSNIPELDTPETSQQRVLLMLLSLNI